MKLNIHNVIAWLEKKGVDFRASLASETIIVECVKWLSNEGVAGETLYVSQNRGTDTGTIVVFENGSLNIAGHNPESVFYEFLMMFRYYGEMENRALHALFYERSLEEIATMASNLFSCPVIIESEDNKLLAGSESDYRELNSSLTGLSGMVESFDLSSEYTSPFKEKAGRDNTAMPTYAQLRASIWYAKNKVGRIIVCRYMGKINEGTVHLLKWLTLITERLVALDPKKYYRISSVNQKLHMLLINQKANVQEVERTLSKINWHSGDRYLFVIISGFTNTEYMDILVSRVRKRTGEFRYLYNSDRLIFLGNISYESDFLNIIRASVSEGKMKLRISYSYPFYGWNNLSRFYYQARDIADYAEAEQISEMGAQSFAVMHLKNVARSNPVLNKLQHPDIIAIKQYDEQHNTSYLSALQSYLLSGCRIEMASKVLDIHPNTLRYRIKKLEEILPGNLYNPDYRRELIYAALLP